MRLRRDGGEGLVRVEVEAPANAGGDHDDGEYEETEAAQDEPDHRSLRRPGLSVARDRAEERSHGGMAVAIEPGSLSDSAFESGAHARSAPHRRRAPRIAQLPEEAVTLSPRPHVRPARRRG